MLPKLGKKALTRNKNICRLRVCLLLRISIFVSGLFGKYQIPQTKRNAKSRRRRCRLFKKGAYRAA